MEPTKAEKPLPLSTEHPSDGNGNEEWCFEAILGPEYTAPVKTVNVWVEQIVDKRHTSRLVQELQRLSPIPSLKHLKRVSPDGRIIICLDDGVPFHPKTSAPARIAASSGNASIHGCVSKKRPLCEMSDDLCSEQSKDVQNGDHSFLSYKCEELSSTKVIVGVHTEEVCLAPAGLSQDGLSGRPERCAVPASQPLTRRQFLEAQRLWPCNFHPARGIEAALGPGAGLTQEERRRVGSALSQCLQVCSEASVCTAAAAIRPSDGQTVALAVDNRCQHPLQHVGMRLVDLVARSQGGGVWPQIAQERVGHEQLCQPSSGSKRDDVPYLCTGLDIVITREPCAMCAMALTHARARRIFFCEGNPKNGVLFSNSPLLHTLPALNHRFLVFRVQLVKPATT